MHGTASAGPLPRPEGNGQLSRVDREHLDTAPPVAADRAEQEGLGPPRGMEPDEFLAAAVVPADAVRERLLSFMVHEIRNPLASALWGAEMIERRGLGDPRGDRMAALSSRSIRRLRSLLEDLFALERLPRRVPPGRVELALAVRKALEPHDLEPAGLDATVEGPEGLESPLNPRLVERMLRAVLRRASRAGEGGPVTVTLRRIGDLGEVEVVRYGLSREALDPPMLASGGSEGAGTTFSLLLARAVAQRLGVALETRAVAEGAAIRLLFPLLAERR